MIDSNRTVDNEEVWRSGWDEQDNEALNCEPTVFSESGNTGWTRRPVGVA